MDEQVRHFDNSKIIIALPGVCKIMDKWKCSSKVKSVILGFESEASFQVMLSDPSEYVFNQEQIDRMSYILNIYTSLHTLINNAVRADDWVNLPNSAPLFDGKPTIEFIKKGKVSDLELVARYLQSFY